MKALGKLKISFLLVSNTLDFINNSKGSIFLITAPLLPPQKAVELETRIHQQFVDFYHRLKIEYFPLNNWLNRLTWDSQKLSSLEKNIENDFELMLHKVN